MLIGGKFTDEGYKCGYLGCGGSYFTPTNPLLWNQPSAKLKQIQNYTFSIIVSNVPNGSISLIVDNAEEAKGDTPWQKSYLVCTLSPQNSDSLVNG